MTDLARLIEKLEASSEGTWDLDMAIADYVRWDEINAALPAYTTSLDAALSLVPTQWDKDIWMKRYNGYHWEVELHIPSSEIQGRHKQLPLALCIAALRARMTS